MNRCLYAAVITLVMTLCSFQMSTALGHPATLSVPSQKQTVPNRLSQDLMKLVSQQPFGMGWIAIKPSHPHRSDGPGDRRSSFASLGLRGYHVQWLGEIIATERLVLLQQSLNHLQEKIDTLQEAVVMLMQEVIQLKKTSASGHPFNVSNRYSPVFSAVIEVVSVYRVLIMGSVVMVVLLLLLWRYWPRKHEKSLRHMTTTLSPAHRIQEEQQHEDHEQGMSAKLNLAHAYIAMEDYQSARKILKAVTEYGNLAQQEEARVLLDTELPISS